jgi:hypothetical protein
MSSSTYKDNPPLSLQFYLEQIEQWLLERLKPKAKNAGIHLDDQGAKIAASPVTYGWTPPILVSGGGAIIFGYGRITVERSDGAGFSAYLPGGRFTILLCKTVRHFGRRVAR